MDKLLYTFDIFIITVFVCLFIANLLLRRSIKRLLAETKALNSHFDKTIVEKITGRLDLLSRENNKLMEENELLRERLRNLGIRDFDVIK